MFNVDAMARRMLLARWNDGIKDATLVFHGAGGSERVGLAEPLPGRERVELAVQHPRMFTRTLSMGSLGLAESYMDHDFEVTRGGLEDFLAVLVRNGLKHKSRMDPLFALKYLGLLTANALRGADRNVQSHYDVRDDVYEAMLDPLMVYTCGYAKSPDDDLVTLQRNKLERICQKLQLKEGETLLDLGCGCGGFLIYAAREHGIRGVGITNSPGMANIARRRITETGLADRIEIRVGDFSTITGQYDKVASIGMMEHLRESEYATFVQLVARRLRPSGLALLHFCGSQAVKNRHDPFIQKYLFPGSSWPRLSVICTEAAKAKLAVLDIENMVRHYALTIRRWRENFQANYPRLDHTRYDDRFKRMWEYFLAWGISAASAADGGLFQILLTNDYARPMPLQRV